MGQRAMFQHSALPSGLVETEVVSAPGSVAQKSQKVVEDKTAERTSGLDLGADKFSIKAALAEYIAMTLFIFIGCGSAMGIAGEPGWILHVSLAFGFAITSLAYAVGAISGGQINCAVTFGLVLKGVVSIAQGLGNFVAQMLGAVTGAFILRTIIPEEKDKTGGIASNGISEGFSTINALVGEVVGTFLLMFVVLQTAVDPASEANRSLACVAIGFAVFLAHLVLIPVDGCSINPTRTFGTALVSKMTYKSSEAFKDMWVFWVGPLAGAALAAGVFTALTL